MECQCPCWTSHFFSLYWKKNGHFLILQNDEEDQAKLLLKFLPNRGPDAFIRFVEALKADYSWLADALEDEFEAAETAKNDDSCDVDFYKQNDNLLKELLKKGGVPPRPNHFIPRDDLVSWLF